MWKYLTQLTAVVAMLTWLNISAATEPALEQGQIDAVGYSAWPPEPRGWKFPAVEFAALPFDSWLSYAYRCRQAYQPERGRVR